MGAILSDLLAELSSVLAYVPDEKQAELSCPEWLEAVLKTQPGYKMITQDKSYSVGIIPADGNKNIFPLKIREPLILEANNILRKKGLFPEDDGSDDDECVFG